MLQPFHKLVMQNTPDCLAGSLLVFVCYFRYPFFLFTTGGVTCPIFLRVGSTLKHSTLLLLLVRFASSLWQALHLGLNTLFVCYACDFVW